MLLLNITRYSPSFFFFFLHKWYLLLFEEKFLHAGSNVCESFNMMQKVNIVKYTDEEYEKYLNDPVSVFSRII